MLWNRKNERPRDKRTGQSLAHCRIARTQRALWRSDFRSSLDGPTVRQAGGPAGTGARRFRFRRHDAADLLAKRPDKTKAEAGTAFWIEPLGKPRPAVGDFEQHGIASLPAASDANLTSTGTGTGSGLSVLDRVGDHFGEDLRQRQDLLCGHVDAGLDVFDDLHPAEQGRTERDAKFVQVLAEFRRRFLSTGGEFAMKVGDGLNLHADPLQEEPDRLQIGLCRSLRQLVSLQADIAGQHRQVVGDPVIGLVQPRAVSAGSRAHGITSAFDPP